MKNQEINQDWERESHKDFVYLCETQFLLQESLKDTLREPAKIVVIDTDNILDKKTHETKHYSLPF
jgi:hypothetical protein